MDIGTYTDVHVALSLAGIGAGFVVAWGLVRGWAMPTWTAAFLATTAATTLTGFGFPITAFTPALGTGIVSAAALAAAIAGRYLFRLRGRWRAAYVVGAVAALYLNVFVLVVQAFQKVPALNALAPEGNEPPFAVAQALVLALFVWVGASGIRRFRPAAP